MTSIKVKKLEAYLARIAKREYKKMARAAYWCDTPDRRHHKAILRQVQTIRRYIKRLTSERTK